MIINETEFESMNNEELVIENDGQIFIHFFIKPFVLKTTFI
jgi:hypothetical protein